MNHRKKLIEVALPLEAINKESAREKSIRHGHPSTVHLWWSRKPLAACRAVLFAQLVDDPSSRPEEFPTEKEQDEERKRLFNLIEELVKWENINNEEVLKEVKSEIKKSVGDELPPVLDPFCGGGSIPLEAQRLGLEAHGSDLNPVAVIITKALIELPFRFVGMHPVRPVMSNDSISNWEGAKGLAEDIRYYGKWIRDEAKKRISHLYPKITLPKEYGGGEGTVIAWLWVRTVSTPNPALKGIHVPLCNKWWLSNKKNKKVWVEPVIDQDNNSYSFKIKKGSGNPPEGTVNRRGAKCLITGAPIPYDYIRKEGQAGRLGRKLMAIVAEGQNGRVYLPPNDAHEIIAKRLKSTWVPTEKLTGKVAVNVPLYGIKEIKSLFTNRQLFALTTFSDLVEEVKEKVTEDIKIKGMIKDGFFLEVGGKEAKAYSEIIATYLTFAVNRLANRLSTICIWNTQRETIEQTFGRQAIPMTWDYAEANVFSSSTGSWDSSLEWIPKVLEKLPKKVKPGKAEQKNATSIDIRNSYIIATDPPYYDNIAYADLSDFFYIWLRKTLKNSYPSIFSTLTVPKNEEIVATPYRFEGDKSLAKNFFEENIKKAFETLFNLQDPEFPIILYYAFKQAELTIEDKKAGRSIAVSTGWETMLESLLDVGFTITGTWPLRTERDQGLKTGSNVLASSIVLVCRKKLSEQENISRKDYLTLLRKELPDALKQLQKGNIAPVDMAQAAIGPGMAVFSRYSKVIEADGSKMSVRTTLQIINEILDEVLTEQEGYYDSDTRWAIAWFEQFGIKEGEYGVAETLSKAKNTSVRGLSEAGIVLARGGKVKLTGRKELVENWDPLEEKRLSAWKAAQYLIYELENKGEEGAAILLNRLGALGETARDLSYRLYSICERKGWAEEALRYNSLVISWPEINRLARRSSSQSLFDT